MLHRRWIGLWVLLVVVASAAQMTAMNSMAQDATPEITPEATASPAADDIPLEPFTIRQFDVNGVRPAEWDVLRPGGYTRSTAEGDIAALLHIISNADSIDDAASPFLPALLIDELPAPSTTYEGAVFEWELYDISFDPPQDPIDQIDVQMAAAQDADAVYLILFQALPDEFDALREAVLLPALDNFGRPLADIYETLGLAPLGRTLLEPFEVYTVTPVGWQVVNPGAYMRQATTADPTTLLIQSAADTTPAEYGEQLLTQLRLPGGLPRNGDPYETTYLDWMLYRLDVEDANLPVTLSIALADDDDSDRVYLVVLLSRVDEAETLRETIWFPVLDATEPLP